MAEAQTLDHRHLFTYDSPEEELATMLSERTSMLSNPYHLTQ